MPDREKVIKELEECLNASCRGFRPRLSCPYNDDEWDIMRDALALLKEQEAKDIKSYYGLAGGPHGACPSCCTTIPRIIGQETRFCPFCGQAVKWDA